MQDCCLPKTSTQRKKLKNEREADRRFRYGRQCARRNRYQLAESPDGTRRFNYISPRDIFGIAPEDWTADANALKIPDDEARFNEALSEPAHIETASILKDAGSSKTAKSAGGKVLQSPPCTKASGATVFNGLILDIGERKRLRKQSSAR